MQRDAANPLQSALFPPPGPAPRVSPETCPHPSDAQFRTGNLFTGNTDVVCGECNATLAPSFSVEKSNR